MNQAATNHLDFDAAQPDDVIYETDYGVQLTKREFIELAGGNLAIARNLRAACEWQHPAALIDELQEQGGIDYFRPEWLDLYVPEGMTAQDIRILHGRYEQDGAQHVFLAIYGLDDTPIYKDNQQDPAKIAALVGDELAQRILSDEGDRLKCMPKNYRRIMARLDDLRLGAIVEAVNPVITDADEAAKEARIDADMAAAQARQQQNFSERVDAIGQHAKLLCHFIPDRQLRSMLGNVGGEEGQFFSDKLNELHKLVETMPKSYEQDGLGDEAVVHLHYFKGGADFFITERDMGDGPDAPIGVQHQAFGLADLFGDGGELGYISIAELLENNVELDLHWQPKTLAEVRRQRMSSTPTI